MNIINENMLHSILTSKHHGKICSIRILDWNIDDDIVKAGSNYCTQVSRLIVRYHAQTGNNENDIPCQKGIFFLKVPANAPLYEMVKQYGSYDKEVAIYTEVLPKMYTIDGEDDDDDQYFSPRHFYSNAQNFLVLEDLSQFGYRCADRVQQLDIKHCFHALQCLAKFHALSVKLETTAGLPESVKLNPFLRRDGWCGESSVVIKSQIPMFVDSLPQNLKDQYPDTVTYFQSLSSLEALTKMEKQLLTGKFNVLNHGDFWTNNIMFKYDKYGSIKKVKLIDFQLTSWSSPAKDLIYFIITSVKFELYRTHFPLLLRIYLDTLNRVLGRLNCPTYNMNNLLDDIDSMFPYASTILCTMLPVFISDLDDPIDVKEMSKDDKFKINGVAKGYTQKHFQNISAKWFEHFARKGTLRIDEENIPTTL